MKNTIKNLINPSYLARGRINRLSSVLSIIFLHIAFLLGLVIANLIFKMTPLLGGLLSLILLYLYIIYYLQILIRRFHDLGYSGWNSIIGYIPFMNIVLIIFLIFAKGEAHKNEFGYPVRKSASPIDVFFNKETIYTESDFTYEVNEKLPTILATILGIFIIFSVAAYIQRESFKEKEIPTESSVLPNKYANGIECSDIAKKIFEKSSAKSLEDTLYSNRYITGSYTSHYNAKLDKCLYEEIGQYQHHSIEVDGNGKLSMTDSKTIYDGVENKQLISCGGQYSFDCKDYRDSSEGVSLTQSEFIEIEKELMSN